MRILLRHILILPALAAATFSQTQNWTGILVDADCRARSALSRCPASSQTEHFGLLMPSGNVIPIDQSGAEKVRSAMEGRTGDVSATIYGTLTPDYTIRVQSASASGASMEQPPAGPAQPQYAENPPPAPQPQAPRCALELEQGLCYNFKPADKVRVRKIVRQQDPQRKRPQRVTLTGTLDGDTVRVDSVTVR